MLKFVLDLFFPPVCGICGIFNKDWICEKCKKKLDLNKKSVITNIYGKEYKKYIFIFLYEDVRNIILDYKFYGKSYLYHTFCKLILEDNEICKELKKYDVIIPVPMNKKKKARRGYNQTELISKYLAKELGLEYNNKSLTKLKANKTQSTLTEKERFENVKNVFEIQNSELLKGKKIILFDDILTTGATIDECSKVLKKNGVNDIVVLTLAKD